MLSYLLVLLLRYRRIGRVSVVLNIAQHIVVHPADWLGAGDRIVNPAVAIVRLMPTTMMIDDHTSSLRKPNGLERRFLAAAIGWRLNSYPRRAPALP
jgi:hypothetical protein